ncbi:MAG TPA: hypothetical protein VMF70_13960 [Gemmatimonadales bacterium]|nr:hypothetical protein [Gemmatimonadales bacterium]
MTLADLPVLNPSTPGREARRAVLVALLFAAFGALYALARAAAAAPPDLSASTGDVFGFAYPRGWGLAVSMWSGAARWPTSLANAETFLAVTATVIMAIALIVVMHPDILVRQGPQYVSPARRITTVVVAFVMAFLMYRLVIAVDGVFSFDTLATNPDKARRVLVGLGALAAIVFGGIWSFIGPKDFGRRIPLRISHGALGGLAVWGAVALATLLSSQARGFLSSTLDTFYTLLTVDAANGTPGATAGWAVASDVLTAATAMALAGALLIVTAPQSLGPGNRRGSAIVSGVVALFLIVVAATTWSTTQARAREVNVNVTSTLQLDRTAPSRTPVLLTGQNLAAARRLVARPLIQPTTTADDCMHPGGEGRDLPARTASNVRRLTAWLDTHQDVVNGTAVRVASCRAALQALLWEPDSARAGIFLSRHPERVGALTYLYAMSGVSTPRPAFLRRMLASLADTARFAYGAEAPKRFVNLARLAGDTAAEAAWRQRSLSPATPQEMASMPARPAYVDGVVSGRIAASGAGWRIALLIADEPGSGSDPTMQAPRSEGSVLSSMVTAADVGADGRFSFGGLRDGFYQLALLSPEGVGVAQLTSLVVKNDPGVFQLAPARKNKDVGTISLTY